MLIGKSDFLFVRDFHISTNIYPEKKLKTISINLNEVEFPTEICFLYTNIIYN